MLLCCCEVFAMHWSLKLSPDRCIVHSLTSLFSASKLTFSNPFPYFTSQQTFILLYTVLSLSSAWVHIYSSICTNARMHTRKWVQKSNRHIMCSMHRMLSFTEHVWKTVLPHGAHNTALYVETCPLLGLPRLASFYKQPCCQFFVLGLFRCLF